MNAADLSAAVATALADAGTTMMFGVPGGGNNLDLIGAAEAAGIRFVLAHAETPAAIMASVYGDITGTPAACVVTRGPGAMCTVNGVANALLERQPLVLITDVVSLADADRIAHQRLDQSAVFAPLTKLTAVVGADDPSALVTHAARVAMSLPRGPVHLDFDPSSPSTQVPPVPSAAIADPEQLHRLAEILEASSRPVVLVGVGARQVAGELRSFVAEASAPVLMTYRAQGLVPDSWPCVAVPLTGATTESPLLHDADLVVMLGVDTVEFIHGTWPYAAPVVALGEWAEENTYVSPVLQVVGDLGRLIDVLREHWPVTTWAPDAGEAHRHVELATMLAARPEHPDGVVPQDVVRSVRRAAPAGTVATVDAGAHMLPVMSLWTTEQVDEVLISSGLATMGFALPAAIAAGLARPDRRIVCFTGDGGLGMCIGELETVSRLGLPITVVVFNDARLSLIEIKAKPEGHGGANAVRYGDTDFATIARGYGLTGVRVETLAALNQAVATSFRDDGPTLIDIRVDPSSYADVVGSVRGARPSR